MVFSYPPFLKNFSLEGRVALVTGGSGGIGQGICTALAESGADIVSLQQATKSIEITEKVEQAQRKCHVYYCDLSRLDDIPPVMQEIMAKHNPSIIINCAGVHISCVTTDLTIEEIDRVLRINTTASIIVAQEAVKYWEGQPEQPSYMRKIINFASISSFRGDVGSIPYVASKGAVLNMTRGMSNEWAPRGICVNCVAPGYTKSRMTEKYYNMEAFNEKLYKTLPAKRWGEPKDVAAACVYLSSPASDYVTGTCLVVDGGVLGGSS